MTILEHIVFLAVELLLLAIFTFRANALIARIAKRARQRANVRAAYAYLKSQPAITDDYFSRSTASPHFSRSTASPRYFRHA